MGIEMTIFERMKLLANEGGAAVPSRLDPEGTAQPLTVITTEANVDRDGFVTPKADAPLTIINTNTAAARAAPVILPGLIMPFEIKASFPDPLVAAAREALVEAVQLPAAVLAPPPVTVNRGKRTPKAPALELPVVTTFSGSAFTDRKLESFGATSLPAAYPTPCASGPVGLDHVPENAPELNADGEPEFDERAEPEYGIGTLCINCRPLNAKVIEFHTVLAEGAKKLSQDYRLFPYGTGSAALVEAVGAVIKATRPEILVIDTNSPEASLCLNMLKGVSGEIVIGTR